MTREELIKSQEYILNTRAIQKYNTYPKDEIEELDYTDGYVDGATDQRKEIIDKACEWLRDNMNIHQVSFALTNPPEPGKFINAEIVFRKAME